jgi:hypothetical protein
MKNEIFEKLKLDYENLFSTDTGKRVLEDIMKSGLVKRTTFHVDPYVHALNAGRREMALHIADMAEPRKESKQETARVA